MYDYEICKETIKDGVCIDVLELAFSNSKREAEKTQRDLRKEHPGEIITIRQYKETKKEERHLVMVLE